MFFYRNKIEAKVPLQHMNPTQKQSQIKKYQELVALVWIAKTID